MSDLMTVATDALRLARHGEEVEIFVSRRYQTRVRARQGTIDSVISAESIGVGVRVVARNGGGEGTVGFAWADSIGPDVIETVVGEARENARFSMPEPCAGIASPDGVSPAELVTWQGDVGSTPVAAKIALALELERRARAGDQRISAVPYAEYHDSQSETALATTTGIRSATARTSAALSVTIVAAGSGGVTHSGSATSTARGVAGLDVDAPPAEAVARAVRVLGGGGFPAGPAIVVFDPRVTATIMSAVGGALRGDAVIRTRSMFAGRLGEKIAAAAIDLTDDPTDSLASGSGPCDDEGLASRPVSLIAAGVLSSYVHDTVSARQMGTQSTASAVRAGFSGTPVPKCRALRLRPTADSQAAILADVGSGLYVQSLLGARSGISSINGDFSVAIEGCEISGGSLGRPVRGVTLASNLAEVLRQVRAVGDDIRWPAGAVAHQTIAVDGIYVGGSEPR